MMVIIIKNTNSYCLNEFMIYLYNYIIIPFVVIVMNFSFQIVENFN